MQTNALINCERDRLLIEVRHNTSEHSRDSIRKTRHCKCGAACQFAAAFSLELARTVEFCVLPLGKGAGDGSSFPV